MIASIPYLFHYFYGNIIFDVHFLFQEHNWGVKQGLHVMQREGG